MKPALGQIVYVDVPGRSLHGHPVTVVSVNRKAEYPYGCQEVPGVSTIYFFRESEVRLPVTPLYRLGQQVVIVDTIHTFRDRQAYIGTVVGIYSAGPHRQTHWYTLAFDESFPITVFEDDLQPYEPAAMTLAEWLATPEAEQGTYSVEVTPAVDWEVEKEKLEQAKRAGRVPEDAILVAVGHHVNPNLGVSAGGVSNQVLPEDEEDK